MGLARDFKVFGHQQHSVIHGTIFVCTCCSGKSHFPDSGRLVCELTSRICAFAEVSCVHEGACQDRASHASSPAALPHSGLRCISMKASGSEASVYQVPSRIRRKPERALITRCSRSSHSRNNLFWMNDDWMNGIEFVCEVVM